MGTNNLRRGGNPVEVAKLFRDFVENLPEHDTHVILTGLIPSPETDGESRQRFQQCSKELLKISTEFKGKFSYTNTSKLFIKHNVLNKEYYADGVHLNMLGARKLAGEYRACLNRILSEKIFT